MRWYLMWGVVSCKRSGLYSSETRSEKLVQPFIGSFPTMATLYFSATGLVRVLALDPAVSLSVYPCTRAPRNGTMASSAPPLLDLAGTSYDPATRPSVYELLAADELRELVQPAFRYVLAVGEGRPGRRRGARRG